MLLHGCSYEKYTRTCYTDSQNSPSTVSYRNTEYNIIPKLDVMSVRQPLWVSVREEDASQAALDYLHRVLNHAFGLTDDFDQDTIKTLFVTLERGWRFFRKTGDYWRMYWGLKDASEKLLKFYKTHRNIGDIELKFIKDS